MLERWYGSSSSRHRQWGTYGYPNTDEASCVIPSSLYTEGFDPVLFITMKVEQETSGGWTSGFGRGFRLIRRRRDVTPSTRCTSLNRSTRPPVRNEKFSRVGSVTPFLGSPLRCDLLFGEFELGSTTPVCYCEINLKCDLKQDHSSYY